MQKSNFKLHICWLGLIKTWDFWISWRLAIFLPGLSLLRSKHLVIPVLWWRLSSHDAFCEDKMKFDLLLHIFKAIRSQETSLPLTAFIDLLNLNICLFFISLSFKISEFLEIVWCFISDCFYIKEWPIHSQRNSKTTYRKKRERAPLFLKLNMPLSYLILFVKRKKITVVFCHEHCFRQLSHFILHNENDFCGSKVTALGWVSTWKLSGHMRHLWVDT